VYFRQLQRHEAVVTVILSHTTQPSNGKELTNTLYQKKKELTNTTQVSL
jgi:hypothetical protein